MSREGGRRVRKHRNGANRWDGTRKNSCCGYLVYLVAYKKLHGVGITINWHDHLQDLNNRPLTFIKDQTRFFLVSLWKTEANPESHGKQPPSRTRPYLRKWRAGGGPENTQGLSCTPSVPSLSKQSLCPPCCYTY